MAETRMIELAEELLRRSRERKVPWEEGPRGPRSPRHSYQVVFPDGSLILTRGEGVTLSESPGKIEEYTGYQLDLISDTGRIIDSLGPSPKEPIYQVLTEIYELAESYIRDRGINKALDFLKSR